MRVDMSVPDMFHLEQRRLGQNLRHKLLIRMSKRLPRKEFLALAEMLWQSDAKVRYQNPDARIM
jgi:hypothetical protein